MAVENHLARAKRLRQRVLFDTVADLYDASRPACTDDAVDQLVRTARLHAASRVLEVGCGTGQLTGLLADRGVQLTAIDIGESMVAAARRRVIGRSIAFRVSSFEELVAPEGSFDLIVSADAFHWVDPEIRFSKSARLLRPDGWLALLSLEQVYDEPLDGELRGMWAVRSDGGRAWLTQPAPTIAQAICGSGHFGEPIEVSYSTRLRMPPSSVLDLEQTRATSLSWAEAERREFVEELRGHLPAEAVDLTQVATVTMAQVAAGTRGSRPGRPSGLQASRARA